MMGRQFGYRLLVQYGGYLRITEGKIKFGENPFLRFGITIVIVARFVPVLRSIIGAYLRHLSYSPTSSVP